MGSIVVDFFQVNPKEASSIDLVKLLFSSNIKKRKFINSSYDTEESFAYRFIIVLSVLVQKFMLVMSPLMELMGNILEYVLNFHHSNGGFIGILRNIMHVKVVIPHWNSAEYLSLIGLLDGRKKLDSEIKHGDPMYYPALSIMACKTVYSNAAYNKAVIEDSWKMEFLKFENYWNDYTGKPDTQVVMFRDRDVDHDTIVVCFRGTEPFNLNDWCSDVDLSWHEIRDAGRIHSGFLKALGMQTDVGWPEEVDNYSYSGGRKAALAYYDVRDTLRTLLRQNPDTKFIVTGHSLGGALAALFPAICFYHDERLLLDRMEGIYTFGQPRVGNEAFGDYMKKNLDKRGIEFRRYVYCNDMVPRVPPNFEFKHFGTCVYFDSRYQSKEVEEVPYENYFSIWGAIAMRRNAMFELMRSFFLERRYGEDYKESWLLFGMRMVGLVIPGLPAHCPQDYVNSTRLGTVDLIHRIFHH